jgi:CBS domain-containing protein
MVSIMKPTTLASFQRPVVIAALGETVAEAARRLRDQRVGCLVVTRDGRPIGIVTDRDLALRVVPEARDADRTLVDDVLTYAPVTLTDTESVDTATRYMRDHGVRRLPIVDASGAVTGIVTADDLLMRIGRQLSAVGEAIAEASDAGDSR